MYQQNKNYRIFWEKTLQNEARILRIFGSLPSVTVPEQIDNYPVTELNSYCFANDCCLSSQHMITNSSSCEELCTVTELCGSYIESVYLPNTLTKIGDYAFYNCRNLKKIIFGKNLVHIGSDAFMNCRQLHRLYARCSAFDKTSLRQILAQIFWDVEVSFLGSKTQEVADIENAHIEASVFYPEYYEIYDEIAPAHIFGRKIIGEGFRARQRFKDGVIDFAQYDEIFKKACSEESVQTMCHLLLCRLRYPVGLSDEKKAQYKDYIQTHGQTLCQLLIETKQLDLFLFLIQNKMLLPHDIQAAAEMAAKAGWGEGSASLQHWKQQYYPFVQQHRYRFDNF